MKRIRAHYKNDATQLKKQLSFEIAAIFSSPFNAFWWMKKAAIFKLERTVKVLSLAPELIIWKKKMSLVWYEHTAL